MIYTLVLTVYVALALRYTDRPATLPEVHIPGKPNPMVN